MCALRTMASSWLNRVIDRLYIAALVEKEIPHGFRSHVFVLRVTGAWPTTNVSSLYKCLTIAFLLFVGIVFPLSLPFHILYSNFEIQDVLLHSFASLSALATTFKMFVIYWRRDSIRGFFCIHTKLISDGGRRDAAANDQVAQINIRLHVIFTTLYVLWDLLSLVQSVLASPEHKTFISTRNLPYDFTHM